MCIFSAHFLPTLSIRDKKQKNVFLEVIQNTNIYYTYYKNKAFYSLKEWNIHTWLSPFSKIKIRTLQAIFYGENSLPACMKYEGYLELE